MSEEFRERELAASYSATTAYNRRVAEEKAAAATRQQEAQAAIAGATFEVQRLARQDVRVEDSFIAKEKYAERETAATTAAGTAYNVRDRESVRAMQRRKAEADKAVADATRIYQETVTPLEERTREIALERPRTDPGYRAPVGPMLIAAGEEELAAEGYTPEQIRQPIAGPPAVKPVVEGLDFRVDSGVRKLLFLGVVASIVKGLSKS